MHTPELCELNMALLADKEDGLPDEILKIACANLVKASSKFKLEVPTVLAKYAEKDWQNPNLDLRYINEAAYSTKLAKRNQMQKIANLEVMDSSNFALSSERKYPIYDAEHVKIASSYFDRYHNEMDPEESLKYAINTYRAASKHFVDLSGTAIEKYACLSPYFYNEDVVAHINVRRGYTTNEEALNKYAELAGNCHNMGILKTARVLTDIDELAGVTQAYGHTLEEPLTAVLGHTKVASIELDDRVISQDMINSALDKGGKDFVDSETSDLLKSSEGMDVFSSLPMPIRQNFYGLMD